MSSVTRFFLLSFIAIGLVACNNEEVPQIETGAKATVTVKIFNDQTKSSRVTGDVGGVQVGDAEREIKTLQVWLFAGNELAGVEYFQNPTIGTNFYSPDNGDSYMVKGIETTSGERTMVAIANHPKIDVSTKTALLDRVADGTLSQDLAKGLIMTSKEVSFTLKKGDNFYGEGTVGPDVNQISPTENLLLTRINARIALVGLTFKNESTDARFDEFELTEVALFNARATSKLFGTSLVNGNTFQFGDWYPSTDGSYVGYDPDETSGNIAGPSNRPSDGTKTPALVDPGVGRSLNLISPSNAYYYYAFENVGDPFVGNVRPNKNGTFIVLKGNLLKNGNPISIPGVLTDANGFTYYSIWINESGTGGNVIKRNTQYNLTVNILGAGHPTVDPKEDSSLIVQIEVAPWLEVNEIIDWKTTPTP